MRTLYWKVNLFSSVLFFCIAFFVSCSDSSSGTETKTDPPVFVVEDDEIPVPAAGGNFHVSYTLSNPIEGVGIVVGCGEQWAGDFDTRAAGKISFRVAPNEDIQSSREVVVALEYSGIKESFKISQAAASTFFLTETEVEVGSEGGEVEAFYTITNPVEDEEIRYMCLDEWVHGFDLSIDGKIVFIVDANDLYEPRQSEVRLDYAGIFLILTVSQHPKPIGDKMAGEAAIGDYFMIDGTLVWAEATLNEKQKESCIGVVFSTEPERAGAMALKALSDAGADTFHGLVMAVADLTEGWMWGVYGKDINNDGKEGEPYFANTETAAQMYSNVDGYEETRWMLDQIEAGNLNGNHYEIFQKATEFEEMYEGRYAAPANTTGWFVPSIGQWWDIFENIGGMKEYLIGQRELPDKFPILLAPRGHEAREILNERLAKIPHSLPFKSGGACWSSSEYDGTHARRIQFYAGGNLYLGNEEKDVPRSLRLILAF